MLTKKSHYLNQLNNQRGVSMLEMSIALIILMPILFGIIQWGLIISASISIQNTAVVAAREIILITTNNKETTANNVVTSLLNNSPTLNAANLQSVIVQRENTSGTMMANAWSVTVVHDLPLLFPFVVPNSNNGVLRLTAKAVMQ
jgi:Flp pilus assembly protein TadG